MNYTQRARSDLLYATMIGFFLSLVYYVGFPLLAPSLGIPDTRFFHIWAWFIPSLLPWLLPAVYIVKLEKAFRSLPK